jgi:cobalamin biosynthesis protein CobD/CbiB
MGVLAIIASLLIEQWRPLSERKNLQVAVAAWVAWLEQTFNGGEERHGLVAWLVAVLPPVAVAIALNALLYAAHPVLAFAFHIAVLYLTLGFRQSSHYFTDLQLAVKAGDIERARALLDEWRGASGVVRTREEVVRLAIEEALLASHRQVFGVLLWYMLLPGPSGAILYRLAALLAGRWRHLGAFGRFARRAFHALEWPAVRLTAASFALVGNFEDAVYCWRSQAAAWGARTQGVILAAGAGALGIRLGDTLQQYGSLQFRPELGVGGDADIDAMESTVRLIWRSLVLWMFLLLIVSLAHTLG